MVCYTDWAPKNELQRSEQCLFSRRKRFSSRAKGVAHQIRRMQEPQLRARRQLLSRAFHIQLYYLFFSVQISYLPFHLSYERLLAIRAIRSIIDRVMKERCSWSNLY